MHKQSNSHSEGMPITALFDESAQVDESFRSLVSSHFAKELEERLNWLARNLMQSRFAPIIFNSEKSNTLIENLTEFTETDLVAAGSQNAPIMEKGAPIKSPQTDGQPKSPLEREIMVMGRIQAKIDTYTKRLRESTTISEVLLEKISSIPNAKTQLVLLKGIVAFIEDPNFDQDYAPVITAISNAVFESKRLDLESSKSDFADDGCLAYLISEREIIARIEKIQYALSREEVERFNSAKNHVKRAMLLERFEEEISAMESLLQFGLESGTITEAEASIVRADRGRYVNTTLAELDQKREIYDDRVLAASAELEALVEEGLLSEESASFLSAPGNLQIAENFLYQTYYRIQEIAQIENQLEAICHADSFGLQDEIFLLFNSNDWDEFKSAVEKAFDRSIKRLIEYKAKSILTLRPDLSEDCVLNIVENSLTREEALNNLHYMEAGILAEKNGRA